MWLLLPIKAFHIAKRRLSGLLSTSERSQLAQAMAADVISVAGQCRGVERIVVCSSDPHAEALARSHGAAFLHESPLGATSLAQLIDCANAALQAGGAMECTVVPCDLPLLTCSELERFLAAHRSGGSHVITLATDRRRLGTNLLAFRPMQGFRTEYGEDSFRRHCDWAKRCGWTATVCELPGAAFDIDEPEDLCELVVDQRLDLALETRRFLTRSGLLERISALRPTVNQPYRLEVDTVLR